MDIPLLVLDLGLDIVDGVRRLDLKGDGLAREGLDEDLHTATETEDYMTCQLNSHNGPSNDATHQGEG